MKQYFWIITAEPRVIMHPYRGDLEGQNVEGYQDQEGNYLFREMVEVIQEQGGGYVSYVWQFKDDPEKIEEKVSFVKEYEPWGWIVGTGIYLEEAYGDIGELTRSLLIASIIGLLLIGGLSLYLMRQGIQAEKHRQRILDRLFVSENRYKTLIEYMNEGVTIQDQNERITYVNTSFASMLGYSREELIGKKSFEFLDEKNRAVLDYNLEKRRQGKDNAYELEWKTKHDGRLITLVSPKPIRTNDGEYRGSFAVLTDITRKKAIEEELTNSINEKNVLLQEIHHRVKNNLQLIISMINLQKHQIPDERILRALTDTGNRIQALALIHELLYQSQDFYNINMNSFLNQLTLYLFSLFRPEEQQIDIVKQVEAITLELYQAIPVGLILNELLSNALKYAFDESGEHNRIEIHIARTHSSVVLEVSDNGVGLPDDLSIEETKNLGLQLVDILTTQLNGELEFPQVQHGTHVRITFPAS
jgi:PAS domain S-box-containing protein